MNSQNKEWFQRAFAEDYARLYAHRSLSQAYRQTGVMVRLVPFSKGQRILDIACGAGRHMLAMVRRGAKVSGIDLSPVLLAQARAIFRSKGVRGGLRQLDMRLLDYDRKFEGGMIWFTSLGYFDKKSDDLKVLEGLARSLVPGGWFWIDQPNRRFLEKNLVPHSKRTIRGPDGMAEVEETRRMTKDRVIKKITITDRDGKRSYEERVRLYSLEDFAAMLKKSGLSPHGLLGDYDGLALTPDSPRQIWFGKKR